MNNYLHKKVATPRSCMAGTRPQKPGRLFVSFSGISSDKDTPSPAPIDITKASIQRYELSIVRKLANLYEAVCSARDEDYKAAIAQITQFIELSKEALSDWEQNPELTALNQDFKAFGLKLKQFEALVSQFEPVFRILHHISIKDGAVRMQVKLEAEDLVGFSEAQSRYTALQSEQQALDTDISSTSSVSSFPIHSLSTLYECVVDRITQLLELNSQKVELPQFSSSPRDARRRQQLAAKKRLGNGSPTKSPNTLSIVKTTDAAAASATTLTTTHTTDGTVTVTSS